jgi:uncharacterized protein
MQNIFPVLIKEILSQYSLHPAGTHGISHWARVALYGRHICSHTGVDPKITDYFALFHDSRRRNESIDPGHGKRGAALATELNKKYAFLSESEMQLLTEACKWHTHGRTDADIAIQACWDADRLDLPRVGTEPRPKFLCTEIAIKTETITWARAMAMQRVWPEEILVLWRIKPDQFR